jgi:hypothetical protein
MTEEPGQVATENPTADRGGCGLVILFVLSALALLIFAIITQVSEWTIEQAIFDGSVKVPDLRWAILLGFGVSITIPFGIIQAAVSHPFYKPVYRALFLAGLYCLVLVPVHFAGVTSAQLANVLQIGMSLIFIAGLILWHRRRADTKGEFFRKASGPVVLLALAGGLLSGYMWLLWGAFGSVLDTILNLAAGLCLGAAAVMIIKFAMFETSLDDAPAGGRRDLLFLGFAASLVILAAATGFGHNGNQGILFIVLPWTGWPVAAYFARAGRETRLWPALLLTGLAAAWPLMLIDPDELAFVVYPEGGLIGLAIQASLWTLALGLVISILALINPRRGRVLPAILAGIAVIGAVAIFALLGRPGFYGEKLFVIMKSQVEMTELAKVEPLDQRREQIYRAMTAEAEKSQADIRKTLEQWNISYKPYYLVNAIEINGGPLVRWWLQSRADVDRVLDSPHLRPLPSPVSASRGELPGPGGSQWNLEMIQANQVWSELGATGKGVIVGQSDSGMDGAHPELADSYRGRDSGNDYNWFDPWFGTSSPNDHNGHGTHTLGTILGNKVGVAPDAEWIGCVNLGQNLGNPAVYLDCMQFMLAPFPQKGDPFKDGKTSMGANVLNNSWGCPFVEGCDPNTYLEAMKALRAAGVFVVVSAGNSGMGGCATVQDPPAIYADVMSVGAVDQNKRRAIFSSLGPVEVDGSGRIKPDIMAPGENVLSSFPNNTYSIASGTSMAGPHVVGVVALMWSANPKLIGNIDGTTAILEQTAVRVKDTSATCETNATIPNNETGYGIINAYEAVKMALGK